MHKNYGYWLVSVLLAALLSACAGPIKYGSDYKSTADFSQYKTYAWHVPNEYNKASSTYIANDLVDERIRKGIDQELDKKGFKKVAEGQADFLVNYSVTTEDKIDINTYNTYSGVPGWRYGPAMVGSPYAYYGMGYGYAVSDVETRVTQYKVGTFVVDIVHNADRKLVWRGTAEGKMNKDELTPAERDAKIAEIVAQTLIGFPPK
jgi:hypothetical protein